MQVHRDPVAAAGHRRRHRRVDRRVRRRAPRPPRAAPARARARDARGLESAVVTFDRHPGRDRAARERTAGAHHARPESGAARRDRPVDHTVVLTFDEARSQETADDFVREVLVGICAAQARGGRRRLPLRPSPRRQRRDARGGRRGTRLRGDRARARRADSPGAPAFSSTRARAPARRGRRRGRGRGARPPARGARRGRGGRPSRPRARLPHREHGVPARICLPADGVYAGTVHTPDGREHPARSRSVAARRSTTSAACGCSSRTCSTSTATSTASTLEVRFVGTTCARSSVRRRRRPHRADAPGRRPGPRRSWATERVAPDPRLRQFPTPRGWVGSTGRPPRAPSTRGACGRCRCNPPTGTRNDPQVGSWVCQKKMSPPGVGAGSPGRTVYSAPSRRRPPAPSRAGTPAPPGAQGSSRPVVRAGWRRSGSGSHALGEVVRDVPSGTGRGLGHVRRARGAGERRGGISRHGHRGAGVASTGRLRERWERTASCACTVDPLSAHVHPNPCPSHPCPIRASLRPRRIRVPARHRDGAVGHVVDGSDRGAAWSSVVPPAPWQAAATSITTNRAATPWIRASHRSWAPEMTAPVSWIRPSPDSGLVAVPTPLT